MRTFSVALQRHLSGKELRLSANSHGTSTPSRPNRAFRWLQFQQLDYNLWNTQSQHHPARLIANSWPPETLWDNRCLLLFEGIKIRGNLLWSNTWLTYSQRALLGTSLVVQWLRIRLPMQGTRVQALVWEDPTCHRATKPMHHNYWAHEPQLLSSRAATTEPTCCNYWSPCA